MIDLRHWKIRQQRSSFTLPPPPPKDVMAEAKRGLLMFSWPILLDQVHTQVSVNYYQTSQFLRNVYKQIWAISEPSSLLKKDMGQHCQSLIILFFMYFQAWNSNWLSHNWLTEADNKPITVPIVFICDGFMSFTFCLCLQLQQPNC